MKTFTVKVPGVNFELSSNQIYHIREVADSAAPDGYQIQGISKHPLPGVAQGIIVPHHEQTHTWNTGFFKRSYCYTKETPQKAGKILKTLEENFLPELEYLIQGDLTDGRESEETNKFYDEFVPFNGTGNGEDMSTFKIKGGNMFDTSKPLEFLALWFALIGKQIMPESDKGNPSYDGCSFVLEDKKRKTDVKVDREFAKTEAMATVLGVLKQDSVKEKKHLQNVFEYIGFKIDVENTQTKPLISIFSKWTERDGHNNENAILFNEVFERFEEEEKREELIVYVKLLDHIKNSKIKVERTDIYLGTENLGSDKKKAASKIVADQELHKEFLLIE